jgi:glutaredoxin
MPQITLYGTDTCRFTNRARGQLDALGIGYDYVDLQQDRKEEARIRQLSGTRNHTPTVEIQCDDRTRRLVRPNDWQLETELMQAGLLAERPVKHGSRSVIRGPRTIIGDRR